MAGIFSAVGDLVSSILQVFSGILNTVLAAFEGVLSAIYSVVANLGNLAKGLVEFVLGECHSSSWKRPSNVAQGNIVAIGAVVAALVVYSVYQQRRGNIAGGSTTRAKKRA